jgi:hypothetical protein
MGKLANLAAADRAVRNAPLKTRENAIEADAKSAKRYTLYNLPDEWAEAIRGEGMKVATYARVAILEKLRRDGRL